MTDTPAASAPPASAPPPSEAVPAAGSSTAKKLAIGAVVAATTLILLVMLGAVDNYSSRAGFPYFSVDFHWPALLTANTPTGGDMGAHVLLPQYLRDNLLPSGHLFGWSNDWYAGYPALYFYFPLPALATVLLDVLLPYGVAFKLVTVAGLLALPWAAYLLVRATGASRVVAAIATMTGSMFVFMESFSIFGANIKSTLAGEFSFSWSFALSLFYLATVIRDTREGRRLTPKAGVLLALTALSHLITTLVVVVVSLPLLLRRRGGRTLGATWMMGFGLAAFWALPVGVRILQGLTTDMGWRPVEALLGDGGFGSAMPGELVPIAALAIIGFVWALLRREDVAVLATMTVLPFAVYWIIPLTGFTKIYNARLLPYWYLGLYLFAGIAIGLGLTTVARMLPQRHQNLSIGGFVVLLLLLNVTVAGIHDVPGWARWNYTGYEGKGENWTQLEGVMEAIDALPPGRVMWEAASDELGKYGTPMALMLIPYWSDDHTSMEGVFFESSLTTPFHFINASEVSFKPSNPIRGLDYGHMISRDGVHYLDDRALAHLALYDVAYFVAMSPEATEAAGNAGLEQVAYAAPWTIFALPQSSLVDVASFTPGVYDGSADFVDLALEWYADVEDFDHWVVEDGPADWERIDDIEGPYDVGAPLDTGDAVVSDVVLEDHRISFHTTAVGVPHLVKVSYFPNWTATGADGPYRATPSLMVVVPTQEDVVIEFVDTWPETAGKLITAASLVVLVLWGVRRRRRRRVDEMVS